jgi:hypothetical protein
MPSTEEIHESAQAECHEEGQELDMPPTPELGISPITPKTPGSMFPVTPTDDLQSPSFKNRDGKGHLAYDAVSGAEKELDPTTIFVGGLEMFGPSAWDEEKVQNYFGKFGVVEHVKFIRPGQFLRSLLRY